LILSPLYFLRRELISASLKLNFCKIAQTGLSLIKGDGRGIRRFLIFMTYW
jgi:hypothetical protein